jgi:hypothetical protein
MTTPSGRIVKGPERKKEEKKRKIKIRIGLQHA